MISNVNYCYFRNGTCKIIKIPLFLYLYILSEGGVFPGYFFLIYTEYRAFVAFELSIPAKFQVD